MSSSDGDWKDLLEAGREAGIDPAELDALNAEWRWDPPRLAWGTLRRLQDKAVLDVICYRSRDLEWGSLGDGGYWWSTRRWRDCELRYLGPDEEGTERLQVRWGSSLHELLSKTDDLWAGYCGTGPLPSLSGRELEGPSLVDFLRHARRLSRSHS